MEILLHSDYKFGFLWNFHCNDNIWVCYSKFKIMDASKNSNNCPVVNQMSSQINGCKDLFAVMSAIFK